MFGLIKEDHFKQLTKIIPILYLRNKNFLRKKIIKKIKYWTPPTSSSNLWESMGEGKRDSSSLYRTQTTIQDFKILHRVITFTKKFKFQKGRNSRSQWHYQFLTVLPWMNRYFGKRHTHLHYELISCLPLESLSFVPKMRSLVLENKICYSSKLLTSSLQQEISKTFF